MPALTDQGTSPARPPLYSLFDVVGIYVMPETFHSPRAIEPRFTLLSCSAIGVCNCIEDRRYSVICFQDKLISR
jgi:hypothetical protein